MKFKSIVKIIMMNIVYSLLIDGKLENESARNMV